MLHVALSASSRPVSKHTMTLGLDRKASTSDAVPSSSQTSKYSSVQAKNDTAAVPQAMASLSAKPKTLLACKCTELKASGLNIVHTVQLLLTSYSEVLVLKKGDKSRNQTVLRRHSVLSDSFKEHSILTNAVLVEVPQTLLRYVYQFDREKTLKQWLERIAACRSKVIPQPDQLDSATAAGGRDICAKNGMITTNHSAANLGSPVEEPVLFSPSKNIPKRRDALKPKLRDFAKPSEKNPGTRYSQGPGSPEPRVRVQSMTLNRSRPKSEFISTSGSWEYPGRPSSTGTATGSASVDAPMVREIKTLGGSTVAETSRTARCEQTEVATLSSSCGDKSSSNNFGETATSEIIRDGRIIFSAGDPLSISSASSGESKKDPCVSTVSSPTLVVTVPEVLSLPLMSSHTVSGGQAVEVEVVRPGVSGAHSPSCLSRNSSARSSCRSGRAGSARSLNLAVLQETLELSFGDHTNESEVCPYSTPSDHETTLSCCNHSAAERQRAPSSDHSALSNRSTRQRRYSTSSDLLCSCGYQKDARRRSSTSDTIPSCECGDHTEARHHDSTWQNTGFNLSEKRNGFVRRASDQLVGLLKMHSFRERELKKRSYVRMSSSVSELDSMRCSDRNLEFLTSPRRPNSISNNSPTTTPTSPLVQSRILSPSSSPVFARGILEGGLEGEDELEVGEGVNPGAFVVSRFHHTQIRNRKRKQSPRIQRAFSTNQDEDRVGGAGVGGAGVVRKHVRSISESPASATVKALSQHMEQSTDNRIFLMVEWMMT